MTARIPFRWLAKPSQLSIIATAISFMAWEFPSFGVLRKGFDYTQDLDVTSVAVLGCWYLLIFSAFWLGQTIGRSSSALLPRKVILDAIDSNAIYWSFTSLTALGTCAMLFKIFQTMSPQMALLAVAGGQANRLGEALHENYSFGLVSLRYLTVYAAALALVRVIRRRRASALDVLNFSLLVINSTARLILIATFLITVFIMNYDKSVLRVNLTRALLIAVIIFSMLSAVNFARNARYYDSVGASFWHAGVSEILAYLGSPFQCAVGTAKVLDAVVAERGQAYRQYVDVEEALNTNSSFVLMHSDMGYAAWPAIGGLCLSMGFAFSLLRSFGGTGLLLPAAGILYGSTELWRVDLYQQGIFLVWLFCGVGVPLGLVMARAILNHMRKAYPLHVAV